jgi:hypothetical protein
MTILPVQAPSTSKLLLWPARMLERASALAQEALDIVAEAQQQAREAERKYPFTVW